MISSTKGTIMDIIAAYCFFVATIYCGVMWGLHFFWYPGWHSLTLDNVGAQFVGPTTLATQFFTILVPIMFFVLIYLMIVCWKTKMRWATILIMLGIIGATALGEGYIIPINKEVAAGLGSTAILNAKLETWMMLNNARMAITSVMWLGCLLYFIQRRKA